MVAISAHQANPIYLYKNGSIHLQELMESSNQNIITNLIIHILVVRNILSANKLHRSTSFLRHGRAYLCTGDGRCGTSNVLWVCALVGVALRGLTAPVTSILGTLVKLGNLGGPTLLTLGRALMGLV